MRPRAAFPLTRVLRLNISHWACEGEGLDSPNRLSFFLQIKKQAGKWHSAYFFSTQGNQCEKCGLMTTGSPEIAGW
jgi:hypothetical protein